jgi:spore germination protein GerM
LAGPTTLESARRVTTALSSNVRVRSATVSGSIATINFNTAFEEISGTAQVLAVAQVVYTVTGQLGTDVGVQFEIDGTPVPVPTATGAEVTGPVHLLNYFALAPVASTRATPASPGATTTTTTGPTPTG